MGDLISINQDKYGAFSHGVDGGGLTEPIYSTGEPEMHKCNVNRNVDKTAHRTNMIFFKW